MTFKSCNVNEDLGASGKEFSLIRSAIPSRFYGGMTEASSGHNMEMLIFSCVGLFIHRCKQRKESFIIYIYMLGDV